MADKECKAGYYKDNRVVIESAGLVCYGGFGQPRCPYLKKCLSRFAPDIPKNKRKFWKFYNSLPDEPKE